MQPIVEFFYRMINSDLEKEVLRFCAEAGFEIDKKKTRASTGRCAGVL